MQKNPSGDRRRWLPVLLGASLLGVGEPGAASVGPEVLERLTVVGEGNPSAISGAGISDGFFESFGATARLGRLFTEAENRPDAAPVRSRIAETRE